jgi:hypothetical protein
VKENGKEIILFGVKSPLTVDYEETILRTGLELTAAVSVSSEVRLWRRDKLRPLSDCENGKCRGRFVACAFTPSNRRKLSDLATQNGYEPFPALIDPTAVVAESTRIGAGTFINAGAVLGGLSMIGAHVVINRSASVGHHCFLDDYASLGPGVTLTGNVWVGNGSCVGAGSVVLPDVRIGDGAIVSAGSVVRRHVRPGAVVAGNPARVIRLAAASTVLGSNQQE